MLNIIICGGPGSGKGTQSDLMIKKYALAHFSTGDLLRKETASGSELGKEIESYISVGKLIPDQMMVDLLVKEINALPADCKGFILDGFPRTLGQAQSLKDTIEGNGKRIDLFLDLHVPHEVLIERLLNRGKTSGRSDDNLETIKTRLDVYEAKTAHVGEFYKKQDKYIQIDGVGTIDEIFARICSALDNRMK